MMTDTTAKARASRAKRWFFFRRFVRNSDGTTAIEFGILAVPFLLTLFAILETGVSMALQQMLVNATDNVARQIRTGEIKTVTQPQLQTMICQRIQTLVATGCPGLRVDLRTYASYQAAANQQVFILPNNVALEMNGASGAALRAQIGGSNSRQTLRAFYFLPLMARILDTAMSSTNNNGTIVLSASQTWKNEAY